MKIFFYLIFSLISSLAFSQCKILGGESSKIGESIKLMSDVAAKCPDCYFWKFSSSDVIVIQENSERKIVVKGLKPGIVKVHLSVETNSGTQICEKDIQFLDASAEESKKCETSISDFKHVKINDELLSFSPEEISDLYNYQWKAVYADGTVKESSAAEVQLSNSEKNYLNEVTLTIRNKEMLCTQSITKTFGKHYWFPEVLKVKQKKYIQGNYKKE